MSSKIDEYINEICSHVKFQKAHHEIRTEFLIHIEEKIEDLKSQGLEDEEASKRALSQMGDSEIIGMQLNKIHKATPEWSIFFITVLFSFIGLLTIYFILENESTSYYLLVLQKNTIYNIFGYVSIICLYFFDYRRLEKYSKHIFAGTTLVLFALTYISPTINGTTRWLVLGIVNIDISELSLFLYAISLSKILEDINLNNKKSYIYISFMLLFPLSLYLINNTSMIALIYFTLFIMLLFLTKVNLYYVFSVISLVFISIFYTIISKPYLIHRLLVFLNPQSDPEGSGYMNFQLQKLLKSTGLKGNGFTFPQKTIPSIESDFIFTYIVYTFGWITAIILIIIIFTFILRIFIASKKVKNSYGRHIIQSFLCILAMEFIWNILMVLGFVPITGVSLPFISYGGSRLLTQMAAIGLTMNIYKSKSLSFA
jgi:cell division protein FtsW (lipid II flippase)